MRVVRRGRRSARVLLIVALALVFLSAGIGSTPSAGASPATITTIDAPGATYNYVNSINAAGQIVGYFADASGKFHGYLRTAGGTFITIDAPGATGTNASGINDAGQVVGTFTAAGGKYGYLRTAGGTFMTIDVPGATGTNASGINNAGQIVGYFLDTADKYHGFLRAPGGTSITIDVPGATRTYALGINDAGQVVGTFTATGGKRHGYLRTSTGTFTTIDAPGATGTDATGINGAGQIVGFFEDASGKRHGYLRSSDGTFTTIDAPDAAGTDAHGINNAGQIVGYFADASTKAHGYVTTVSSGAGASTPPAPLASPPSSSTGQLSLAIRQYEAALRQAPAGSALAHDAHCHLAPLYVRQGDSNRAAAELAALGDRLASCPQSVRLDMLSATGDVEQRARSAYDKGEFALAVSLYQQNLRVGSYDGFSLYQLMVAGLELRQPDVAYDAAARLIHFPPGTLPNFPVFQWSGYYVVAHSAFALKRYSDVIAAHETLGSSGLTSVIDFYQLGYAYAILGDYDRALKTFQAGSHSYPKNEVLYLWSLVAALGHGGPDEMDRVWSRRSFATSEHLKEWHIAPGLLQLGRDAEAQGMRYAALTHYSRVLNFQLSDTNGRVKRDLLEKVYSLYVQLPLKPAPPRAALSAATRAQQAVLARRYADALRGYRDAEAAAPWWPDVHYNLALLWPAGYCHSIPEQQCAIDEMNTYLRLAPSTDPHLAEARAKIAQWKREMR